MDPPAFITTYGIYWSLPGRSSACIDQGRLISVLRVVWISRSRPFFALALFLFIALRLCPLQASANRMDEEVRTAVARPLQPPHLSWSCRVGKLENLTIVKLRMCRAVLSSRP